MASSGLVEGEHLNRSSKVASVLPSRAARPSETVHLKAGPAHRQTDTQSVLSCVGLTATYLPPSDL